MDDVLITLTCGFTTLYKDLTEKKDGKTCWLCESHPLDVQECLKMPINRINLKKIEHELELKKFLTNKDAFDKSIIDPDFLINESFQKAQNDLDLRREEFKVKFNKAVDDYYMELSKRIQAESSSKKIKFEQNLKQINLLEQKLKSIEIGKKLKYDTIITFLDSNLTEIKEKIDLMNRTLSELKRETFQFVPRQKELNMNDLFGGFEVIGPNQMNRFNENNSHGTLRFVLEKFSLFKDESVSRTSSASCTIQNLEWKIIAGSKEKGLYLGFFIEGAAKSHVKKWAIKVTTAFKVVHLTDRSKDFCCKLYNIHSFLEKNWGFPKFLEMEKLENIQNGFYDVKNDCITLEVDIEGGEPLIVNK